MGFSVVFYIVISWIKVWSEDKLNKRLLKILQTCFKGNLFILVYFMSAIGMTGSLFEALTGGAFDKLAT